MSFWVVTIAIVGGAVALTWVALMERAADIGRAPEHLSTAATAALSEGGETGLVDWLRTAITQHKNYHVYIIGADGTELLGRPLPERLARMLSSPAYGSSSGAAIISPEKSQPTAPRPDEFSAPLPPPLAAQFLPPRLLPVLVSANGKEYRLFVVPHRLGTDIFERSWTPLGELLLASVVTGLASLWLTLSISQPVQALTDATKRLAQGHWAARVSPAVSQRTDELGALARDFDGMASRLHELVETKERLLQDVSHELRSPLARMRVAVGLARQQGGDVTVQLDRMEGEIERLNALIAQVLTLSRLGYQGVLVPKEPVDLVDIIDGIARDAAFEAQPRHIVVDWVPRTDSVMVLGDATLLSSALENVVRNALKYAPDDSTLMIRLITLVTPTELSAQIVVSDQGPGVPEAQLARIFAPFHRVEEARGRDSGGDGLGLAITERVMTAHGGKAEAANRTTGGLEVTLTLPCLS